MKNQAAFCRTSPASPGALALFYPKTRLLRECAYTGITIDALGTFPSQRRVSA
jgi:hypothetical protein